MIFNLNIEKGDAGLLAFPAGLTGTPFSSTPYTPAYAAANAFDGEPYVLYMQTPPYTVKCWQGAESEFIEGTPLPNSYLGLELAVATVATKVIIFPTTTANVRLTDFKVQGSNNGTDWTDLGDFDYTADSQVPMFIKESAVLDPDFLNFNIDNKLSGKSFAFVNTTAYTYYRVKILGIEDVVGDKGGVIYPTIAEVIFQI